ncbi:MAG: ATP-binding protein, partial [Prevotellaceae bacterium]|nr:ATP-binding protein [Prevotellaceae bacterium]
MTTNIIGRKEEIENLQNLHSSGNAEFVAICGRRRVGKTFLVRQVFEGKLTFDLAGLAKANTKEQLVNFNSSLNRRFR